MLAYLAAIDGTLDAVGRECRAIAFTGSRARESWKTVASVLLGLGVSFALLDVEDAYWVAFSAFMVTKASAAETASRAALRILGTVGGGCVGFLLVPFTANDAATLILVMMGLGFVAIFQFQVAKDAYAWMFFGMTGLLVVTVALAAPDTAVPFVAIRIAEITIGSLASAVVAVVASLLSPDPQAGAPAKSKPATLPLWRGLLDADWRAANRLHLFHAARGAVALALLAVLWRVLELESFIGTAVTSFMVMLVPAAPIRAGREEAVRDRGVHRLVGCVLGGIFALLCLAVVSDSLTLWILAIATGVWIAAWIQNGTEGVSYAGSQFALCFLVTLVQGNAAPDSILPPLERLEGVVIGLAALACVNAAWPLPRPETTHHLSPT